MKSYKYYKSGIEYANFIFEDNGDIFISDLDIYTNKFEPFRKFTIFDYIKYPDVVAFQTKLDKDGDIFSKDYQIGELFTISGGEIYSKLDEFTFVQRNTSLPTFPQDIVVVNKQMVGYIIPVGAYITVFIQEGYEKYTPVEIWIKNIPDEKIYAVENVGTQMVKMRDGVELATHIFLPKDINKKVPTILVRTPYGKERYFEQDITYVQRGYALVIQDVRGKGKSQGQWEPFVNEIHDGDDTLNWVVSNEWANEYVGMIGGSYSGDVQWAAATSENPHLKAIVSISTSGSPFMDIPRKGGSLVSSIMPWVFATSPQEFDPKLQERDDWEKVLNIRPVKDIPLLTLGYEIPFYNNWVENINYNEYWDRGNWYSKKENIKVPALVLSGWFDDDQIGSLEAIDTIHSYSKKDRKIILGPWLHSLNTTRDLKILGPLIHPDTTPDDYENKLHLGDRSIRYDLDYYYTAWFDNKLKFIQNKIDEGSPVEYFTIGDYLWKSASNWPILDIEYKKMYLDSSECLKDGKLTYEIAKSSGYYSYIYNPLNPAKDIINLNALELEKPANYKDEEKRSDILTYTSEVLKEDLKITGQIDINFYASSSAIDTDWVVRICEVDEKGNSIKLVDGLLSARYRDSFSHPKYLCCECIYKFNIKTTATSYTFKKGNKIQLLLTSSANYLIFPNNNNGNGFRGTSYVVAKNSIYYGKKYPSHIILPIEK